MILLEIIVEFLHALTPGKTECAPISQAMSDVADCAQAHEKIQKGDCKTATPFIKYAEYINELNNRKTLAGQIHLPFYDKIRACITSKNLDKKK